MTDSMTRGRNYRSLFLAAMNTYLRYTLCDAQQLHRKAQENHHLHNTDATSDVYRCHSDLIQCIQKILRWQSTSAEMVHVIYGLAMLDRQQQCVLWSDLSVRCGYLSSSCRGSWCTGWRLANDSVTYLDYATSAEMRKDHSLAADWVTASSLCDAAAQQCSLLKHPDRFQTTSDKSEERSRVCETIVNLLIQFPEIVPGETEQIIAINKAKFGMAELLPGLDAFIPRCFPPDSRLAPLYGMVYQLISAAREAVLCAYDRINEAASNHRILLSQVTGLTNLTSACLDALAAVDTCSGYADVPIKSSDTYEILQQCVAETVDELVTAYRTSHLDQPRVVTVTDKAANRLFARLNDIIARAHSLKSAALITQAKARSTVPALIKLYDSKAEAARAARPLTTIHPHIAECYERAANLVRTVTTDSNTNLQLARKFAALADGALASTVTCDQYHQRSVGVGDQQLAIVLKSILDRSHDISQSDLQALNSGSHVNGGERDGKDVVGAVHLVGQAVEILWGRNTTPLQRMLARLKLCIADSSLATDAILRLTVQTVAQSLHALIQTIQHPSALKLAGLSVVKDTPLVRDILQTLVRKTCALARSLVVDFTSVAHIYEELLSIIWHAALKEITRNVAALKRHQLTDTDHALTAHAVDLLLLALSEVVHGRICSGDVLKLTARKFQDARHIDNSGDQYVLRLTPEKRARLRSFRIYLAQRFEQEVLLPFAAAHSPTMAVPVTEFCLQSPDEIADFPFARLVSEVVKVSDSVVSCLRRANSKAFVGTVAARELQDAAGHYQRAADNLALQAEHQIVGAMDSAANSARVSAVVAATRLSLLAAKASEGAHAAAQAERYEIRDTYGRVLILLPDLKDGAELFYGVNVQQAKDAVAVLETLGTYYIYAAQALLNGEYIRAEYWRRAAQICARAVNGGPNIRLDARLRDNWKETVQSAEAVVMLAGGARK